MDLAKLEVELHEVHLAVGFSEANTLLGGLGLSVRDQNLYVICPGLSVWEAKPLNVRGPTFLWETLP